MANMSTPPNDVVEPVERLLRFGVHSTKAADAALGMLDAVPDGWAKIDGEWVEVERVNWSPASRTGWNDRVVGCGDGTVLMPHRRYFRHLPDEWRP